MLGDQASTDREAHTCSGKSLGAVHTLERIKNSFELFFGDPNTIVFDVNREVSGLDLGGDVHDRRLFREFDGVVNQSMKYVLENLGVGSHGGHGADDDACVGLGDLFGEADFDPLHQVIDLDWLGA